VTSVFDGTFGATADPNGVRFRLWAPAVKRARVALRDERGEREIAMTSVPGGWFEAADARAAHGTRYAYLLDDDALRYPDPASRFQPDGVHGDSAVVDPARHVWPASAWQPGPWPEQVVYELHLGTFTPEGTCASAETKLAYLAELGITAIELMPLSQAPGARTWGYDGVLPYAPNEIYGTPDDVKHFVSAAHGHGLAVYLDVVYNHFGPEGSFLHRYAPQFFTQRQATPWGAAIDYSSPGNDPVRAYFIENALYWLAEYRFDGLRFDATQCIYDERSPAVLPELLGRARALDRPVHLVVENDLNEIALQRAGYDAQWNDDVHHAAHVLATGQKDGYYADYAERPAFWFARALASGYAYQGDASGIRAGEPRGSPSAELPLAHFVNFLQNHDQIGNRPLGERIGALAKPEALRAALACVLLAPSVPLLFMGEEWNASAPFEFFCDFEPELARAVREGRAREFATFEGFATGEAELPDATDSATFERCKLDWSELALDEHAAWLAFYRELLAKRRSEIVPLVRGLRGTASTFATLGDGGARIAWRLDDGRTLRLDANLTAAPLAGFAAAPGVPLYTLAAVTSDTTLAPWSVRWSLG